MSNIRYLVDLKNQRSFCLGDRYYSSLFYEVKEPLSLSAILRDLAETYNDLYTPALAQRLYDFCVAADWQVTLRFENTGYEHGRWGDDGFTSVGSVWPEDDVKISKGEQP